MQVYHPEERSHAHYASLTSEEVIKEVFSHPNGLKEEAARKRLDAYGYNVLEEAKEVHIALEFLAHFKSPLVIILLIATAVSAFMHEIADAIIIGVIILMSVTLDFFLEHNAEEVSKKLKASVQTKCTVIRDGVKKEINSTELCEGDIIFLSAGDMVPADARIMEAKDFFVNQSALTGESFPSEKTSNAISSDKLSIIDMKNIAFFGTSAVSGSATAVVIKTGKFTEFGKIASNLAQAPLETEFDKGIRNFGYLIMKSILFLVLFIFLFNSLMKHKVLESFMFALAVAVGLTPELLPMIMSVTMARGSLNMAKKGVIVKKLHSISNFGSMDVLCTDKTGTLTEDKIRLVKYVDVAGHHSNRVLHHAYLNSYHHTGIKNPLDNAVLEYRKEDIGEYAKIDEIPFDFVRKRMSVVVRRSGRHCLITKGAPEEVVKACSHYESERRIERIMPNMKEKIMKNYYELSSEGYRVLAVAIKDVEKKRVYSKHDEEGLRLLGFVAFLDPPKHEVKEVIKEIHNMGIDVKIITGDNELVTKKICDEIDLPIKGILLGYDIDEMTDDALKVRVENTTIFARFSPDEKNRVINALKSNGHIVGYMGDGINDAPSLKTSDIGISVDSAVDVAKESADIILTKKSLHVLRDGILEGRKTFNNTMKYIMMGLSSNFGNMFSVAGAVLLLPFLPMLPIQILLNNFIYDLSQITIPSDKVDHELIQKPKRWDMKFIKRFMLILGPVSSVFDFITFFVLYSVFGLSMAAFQTGWFMESLATQTLVIHVIRTKKIPFIQSTASKLLLLSSIVCVIGGWMLPYSRLGRYLGFEPLPFKVALSIAGIILAYLVVVEVVKRLFYKRYNF